MNCSDKSSFCGLPLAVGVLIVAILSGAYGGYAIYDNMKRGPLYGLVVLVALNMKASLLIVAAVLALLAVALKSSRAALTAAFCKLNSKAFSILYFQVIYFN